MEPLFRRVPWWTSEFRGSRVHARGRNGSFCFLLSPLFFCLFGWLPELFGLFWCLSEGKAQALCSARLPLRLFGFFIWSVRS